tara:strand:- start:182 stop:412 length:231 start_codon:yes stop_codon:yes gene_type:complete
MPLLVFKPLGLFASEDFANVYFMVLKISLISSSEVLSVLKLGYAVFNSATSPFISSVDDANLSDHVTISKGVTLEV